MLSDRAIRLLIAAAAAALLAAPLLVAQGCGGGGTTGESTGAAVPRSNASTPAVREPGDGDAPVQTTPGGDEKDRTQPVTSDRDAAVSAARANAKAGNPSIGELEVTGVKIIDNWARVDLVPADRSTDGASWLLKKTAGAWTVVDYGTSMIPADHPEAPPGLFQ